MRRPTPKPYRGGLSKQARREWLARTWGGRRLSHRKRRRMAEQTAEVIGGLAMAAGTAAASMSALASAVSAFGGHVVAASARLRDASPR